MDTASPAPALGEALVRLADALEQCAALLRAATSACAQRDDACPPGSPLPHAHGPTLEELIRQFLAAKARAGASAGYLEQCRLAQLEEHLARRWILFDPHLMFPGDVGGAFRFFAAWAYAASGRGPGAKALVVDEVWKYCTPTTIPPELALVVQTGRKRGLESVFATQRPHLVNGAVTNEVTELVSFRLQEPAALGRVAELGLDPAAVRSLPAGRYLALNTRTGGRLAGQVF